MLPTRTSIAKRVIAQRGYNLFRMRQMMEDSAYYLGLAKNENNGHLRACYIATARMYNKRYQYYFNNELRKSL